MQSKMKLAMFMLLMLNCVCLFAQPVSTSEMLMGYQEFPIAAVDNMFMPFSNPSLLGTGTVNGIGLAHLNDDEVWKRHYWLFANLDGLSYIYERAEGQDFHTLAMGEELLPAHVLPNLYVGANYRWQSDKFEEGLIRSAVSYRPHNLASLAFTWDNPYKRKPYYRFGTALRPFTLLPSIADHRLELTLDMNYSLPDSSDAYKFMKPIIGAQTQIMDGVRIGGTYNLEEETALLSFSLSFGKTEIGSLLRLKENDNYAIAWGQAMDKSFKPFLGITPPSWHSMKLTGNVVSYRAPKYNLGPINIYDSKDKSIESLIAEIEKAKQDPAVDGILLKNPYFSTSLALQEELAAAFQDFKASGKKLSFYYDNIGNAGYIFAASLADKIYLNPMGSVDLRGLAISSPYFKNMLSSLGIETLNFRSHRYKNAGNMFSEPEMTEAEREVYTAILDGFMTEWEKRLTAGRGTTLKGTARQIIEAGPYYIASEALNKGMVDALIYEDQLAKQLKQDFQYSRSSKVLADYRSYDWAKPKESQIAVIYASGNIVMGKGTPGQKIAHSSTVDLIRKARKNNAYKGIILRVDSGGGSAQASDIILRELELAKTENKKPVVVSMAGVAGSGGYYIACNADKIVANPSTITGSIGVIGLAFNATEAFKKIKVNWSTVKKGEKADLGSLSRPWTEEEKQLMIRTIEHTYNDFVAKVDAGRPNLNLEQVHQYAQGRIWTGSQALEIGLIDALGGMDTALESMREVSGLRGKLKLVDATTKDSGISVAMDSDAFNTYLPYSALRELSAEYLQVYELWKDFSEDKALMLSPEIPAVIQF